LIETPRLILRPWRAMDLSPYAAMMADPEVGDWLGGTLTRAQAEAQVSRLQAEADGAWVVERRRDSAFIGSVGLSAVGDDIPLAPAVEVGWRLARAAWGHGYATEAARAIIDDGFARLGLAEIVAFTASTNRRSQAVMERLGLERDPSRDFDHPRLAAGHALRPHVVYAARRP
jgi:ribosomal-protein-alanine N-acetyltransferase